MDSKISVESFNEYQHLAHENSAYKMASTPDYLCLGMCGEAGEVANEIKKVIRDHGGNISPEIKEKIVEEMGDVLWYFSELAKVLDVELQKIATVSIEKIIRKREKRMAELKVNAH